MSYTHEPRRGQLRMIESERCTGHCCRRFYMEFSPQVLKEKYERWIEQGKPAYHDIGKVYPLLTFLGKSYIGVDGIERQDSGYYYTCKAFDGNGCTIYDDRPQMCSNYPYGDPCKYKQCTMKLEPVLGPLEPNMDPDYFKSLHGKISQSPVGGEPQFEREIQAVAAELKEMMDPAPKHRPEGAAARQGCQTRPSVPFDKCTARWASQKLELAPKRASSLPTSRPKRR